jgi:integrase
MATLYAIGVRCNELRLLKVEDVDSQRMLIHIRNGKGQIPRELPLSPALLERLRIYWRWRKPKDWLFPSKQRPQCPMDGKSIRHLCANAGRRAAIKRHVHPHVFRHASAYYTTFQSSFILKAIALGQAQSTAVYGRYVRLVLVPAPLASLDPCDRLPTAHTVRLALPGEPVPG